MVETGALSQPLPVTNAPPTIISYERWGTVSAPACLADVAVAGPPDLHESNEAATPECDGS